MTCLAPAPLTSQHIWPSARLLASTGICTRLQCLGTGVRGWDAAAWVTSALYVRSLLQIGTGPLWLMLCKQAEVSRPSCNLLACAMRTLKRELTCRTRLIFAREIHNQPIWQSLAVLAITPFYKVVDATHATSHACHVQSM